MNINDKPQTPEDLLRLAGIQQRNRVEIITETVEETSRRLTEKREQFTADELKREHEYRRTEAEGLGRNPQRAQKEADEWLANAER